MKKSTLWTTAGFLLVLPISLAGRFASAGPSSFEGTSQSPIDLREELVTFVDDSDLADLKFRYPRRTDLRVVNTGETVRADVPPGAATLRVGRDEYELLQFHFHTPSEHLLDGEALPLEMHLVHRSVAGELMVVGVFLEEGRSSSALDSLLRGAPEEEGESEALSRFPLRTLLPEDEASFRYSGSLTTEPFTEGVRWAVLTEPMELSPASIEHVRELFPHGNARDVQPLNGREILSELDCD